MLFRDRTTRSLIAVYSLAIVNLLIGGAVFTDPANAGSPIIDGPSAPQWPEEVLSALKKDYPRYRLPGILDLVGLWAYERKQHSSRFPFLCTGDFNGDGRDDIALLVINSEGWKTLIYHHELSGYVRRYDGGNSFGSNTSVYGPQQIVLETVKKGQVVSGIPMHHDAISVSVYEQSEMVLYWANDKYNVSMSGD
jgi:hypothetical protein